MKNSIITALLFVLALAGCEKKAEAPQYDIYENHGISACGISDPLQNIEWLKEYCDNLKSIRNFSSVYIYLYKVIDTDENLFQICTSYPNFDYFPFLGTSDWMNCTGKLVFGTCSGVPPVPGLVEEFMADKELVTELFHLIKN